MVKKVKKQKYVTTQMESYRAFGVEITRSGFITDDPDLIAKLDASPDLNFWFFKAPTDEEVAAEAKAWARKVLADDDVEPEIDGIKDFGVKGEPGAYGPIEVEPMSAGNIDDELEALAEEEQIKAEQIAAEEERKEAGRQAQIAYKEKFRPNAAVEAKAKAKAKKSE